MNRCGPVFFQAVAHPGANGTNQEDLQSTIGNPSDRERVQKYKGLSGDDFRHPLDQQNTNFLQMLPGLQAVAKGLLGPVTEEVLLLENIGRVPFCTPDICPFSCLLFLDGHAPALGPLRSSAVTTFIHLCSLFLKRFACRTTAEPGSGCRCKGWPCPHTQYLSNECGCRYLCPGQRGAVAHNPFPSHGGLSGAWHGGSGALHQAELSAQRLYPCDFWPQAIHCDAHCPSGAAFGEGAAGCDCSRARPPQV
mmetsp:Transcript_1754/g.5089  ORF Transcript_1754/g.5089 Transcript_1754/m.5089 type:complete len:250 (-) Transcript_1754:721-1470(-)